MREPIDIEEIQDSEVAQMAIDARAFLAALPSFAQVSSGRLAFAIPGVLGVFHFAIPPTLSDENGGIWVVVGDLPSACIHLPANESWQAVLAEYVLENRKWVDAVRANGSVDELIPTGMPADAEHANRLERRLEFLQNELVDVRAETVESAR